MKGVAPDKFKGSLTAAQVADHTAVGLEHDPAIRCTRLPPADGGDGSVAAAVAAGYQPHTVTVAGPTGRPHQTTIAFDGSTAVVEVANTCGIALLPDRRLEPLAASSLGFGQAVRAAVTLQPNTVVLALGGSASTDGGLGLLTALGATITDSTGQQVQPIGGQLHQVARVHLSGLPTGVRWIVAGDVDAVLHGPGGAAHIFGPQKGATPSQIDQLDRELARLADMCGRLGLTAAATPGAGAAGGIGFAALLLGAEIRSGAEFWSGREALAEALIPLVGRLFREHGVIIAIYGRSLVNKSTRRILKLHRFARHVDGQILPIAQTLAIVEAPDRLPRSPATIDIAELHRLHQATPGPHARAGQIPPMSDGVRSAPDDQAASWLEAARSRG